MNLIAFGFHDSFNLAVLKKLAKIIDVKHLEYYHEGGNEPFSGCNFSHHGLHYLHIQAGRYDLSDCQLTPLDAPLLSSLSECEMTVMGMFDRHKLYNPLSYSERKSLYHKHLRYWNHIIDFRNIDLAIFSGVPHGSFDYIVYCLCKIKGIKTILFTCPSLLTDKLFISTDWKDPAPDLEKAYLALRNNTSIINQEPILQKDLLDHFLAQSGASGNIPTPYHMTEAWFLDNGVQININRLKILFGRFIGALKALTKLHLINSPEKLKSRLNVWLDKWLAKCTYEFYDDKATNPNLNEKYIYFPLHMQPELTTSPMADVYTDQNLMIQMISHSLPSDVKIYVKEHPYQYWGGYVSRNIDFYNELLKLPNVSFVPTNFDTHLLIKNCLAVATATGTAGWEGLFLGKPFLMFGYHIYQYAPGVFHIKTNKDCVEAIDRILQGYLVNELDLKNFLKAVEGSSFVGPTDASRRKQYIGHGDIEVNAIVEKLKVLISDRPLIT